MSRIAPGQVKYSFVLLFSETVLSELLEKQQRILYVVDLKLFYLATKNNNSFFLVVGFAVLVGVLFWFGLV